MKSRRFSGLLDEVQYLYDTYPGRFRFLLTGKFGQKAQDLIGQPSSRKGASLSSLSPDPAGAAGNPGGARVPPWKWIGQTSDSRNRCSRTCCCSAICRESPSRRRTAASGPWESYVELYLEEEIRREALVRNVGAFQQFLELAAIESGANDQPEQPVAGKRGAGDDAADLLPVAGRHLCRIPHPGLRRRRAQAGADDAPFPVLRQRGCAMRRRVTAFRPIS